MFEVKIDSAPLARKFTRLEKKQLPFATALGLTWTARDAQSAVKQGIVSKFDRPTKFTVEAVYIRAATKEKLEAFVFLRDEATKGTPPVKYLAPNVYGGRRRAKRFEKALQRAGVIGANERAVHARGYPLNAYGNIPATTYSKILRHLRASPDPLQNISGSSRSRKRRAKAQFFFAGGDRGLPRGIYERSNAGIRGILMLVPEDDISYRKNRLPFFEIVRETHRRRAQPNFQAALKYALRTAR